MFSKLTWNNKVRGKGSKGQLNIRKNENNIINGWIMGRGKCVFWLRMNEKDWRTTLVHVPILIPFHVIIHYIHTSPPLWYWNEVNIEPTFILIWSWLPCHLGRFIYIVWFSLIYSWWSFFVTDYLNIIFITMTTNKNTLDLKYTLFQMYSK